MRIGIDLLDVARFGRIAAHPRGRLLVFTTAELTRADTLGEHRRREYLAGRFCAKEATAKVLRRGLGQGLVWRDIEVVEDDYGAPEVRLSGGAKDIAARDRIEQIHLSLTHQGGLVACVAVAVPQL